MNRLGKILDLMNLLGKNIRFDEPSGKIIDLMNLLGKNIRFNEPLR